MHLLTQARLRSESRIKTPKSFFSAIFLTAFSTPIANKAVHQPSARAPSLSTIVTLAMSVATGIPVSGLKMCP